MFRSRVRTLIVFLLLATAATACSFGPPPSCGDDIGGTADTAKFDQRFDSMELIGQATGQPGAQGENGVEFAQGDTLAIQLESKADVAVRACIQPLGGGSALAFDQTQSLQQGQGTVEIGTFAPGSYVIRVIVDGTLVKNFPFVVK